MPKAKAKRAYRRRKPVQKVEAGSSYGEAMVCTPKKLTKREQELLNAEYRGRERGQNEARREFLSEQERLKRQHSEELRKAQTNILTQLSYMMQHQANFMEGAFRVIDRIVPKGGVQ